MASCRDGRTTGGAGCQPVCVRPQPAAREATADGAAADHTARPSGAGLDQFTTNTATLRAGTVKAPVALSKRASVATRRSAAVAAACTGCST